MVRRNIAKEIETGLKEIVQDLKGKGGKRRTYVVPVPNVKAIRRKLGLSQAAFGVRFGLNPRTVQDWEQGRREPDQPARVLLKVIEANPKAVEKALSA
jgi:putative transcriptional regulator